MDDVTKESNEIENIKNAIDECKSAAKLQIRFATTVGLATILISTAFMYFIFNARQLLSDKYTEGTVFGAFAVFALTFSMLISLYRLHQSELLRSQQMAFGFIRIRIAAANPSDGYKTEVRESLTKGAFDYEKSTPWFDRGRVKNPAPGHPGADLSTLVLNKLIDAIEIKIKTE